MERKTHTAILMTLVMGSAVLAGCIGSEDDDEDGKEDRAEKEKVP